jgi:hypothetical protein
VKSFICLVSIIGSFSTFAVNGDPTQPCAHCEVSEIRGNQISGGLAQVSKLAENIQSKEIEVLANRLCSQLIRSETTGTLSGPMAFKATIAKYLDIDVNAKDTRKKVIEFWNLKKDQLICTNVSDKYISPQPVMRRVIDMKIQEDVFFGFLLEDEDDEYEGKVDINIVHVNLKGESETVLDYIQSICDDKSRAVYYDCEELKDLQESLRSEYGGKYVKYAKKYPGYALDT